MKRKERIREGENGKVIEKRINDCMTKLEKRHFELNLQRIPSAMNLDPMPLLDNIEPDVLDTPTTTHKLLLLTVSTNMHCAQGHDRRAHDRRHSSNKEITAGSIVYIKNQRRIHHMGSKMEPRWIGPYLVVVKLKSNKIDKILSNTYRASNLKVYQDEETDSPH
ncbi:Hypothetical predicted protein [Octopus vulgaris]|uniref:Uncharacterized protein n=1 Tax=Octopus vulgaris TaxID=6645 RepID=A0AA36EUV1_OCTVU|nr:Hypothetical predicted protein [Octopus vulgaris]